MGMILRLFVILIDWSKGIRYTRWTMFLVTVTGGLAGLGSTALIAVINTTLNDGDFDRQQLILIFAALCLLVPLSGFVSGVLLLRLTARAAYEMRVRMSRQIMTAPYRSLERLGSHRLLATITDDIPAVTNAVTSLPVIFTQLAIIAACLVYLGWMSWPLLLLLLGYMALGILSYQLPLIRATRYFDLLRQQWDAMFAAIQGLTEGAKELRLNRERRRSFSSQELEPAIDGIRRHGISANTLTIASQNWGEILVFVFIGLTLFVSPQLIGIDRTTLTGYALTVLYMISPLTNLLNTLPTLGRASVAAQKVKELGLSLSDDVDEGPPVGPAPLHAWSSLELHGVSHTYQEEDGEFCLGPLDLTFRPGELVFLIGGNGSGKTTLAKILIGLYEPTQGEIRVDGIPITSSNVDDYRQSFSVVFYDFFLFERLYGIAPERLEDQGRAYLAELGLDQKVQIEGDRLSTRDLSQGQRKRLALLNAYLEDRPIYVFDEWASDQDPVFKKIFYHEILPDLKAQGKMVIAITHDDRYYDLADRLIKLERGRLVDEDFREPPAATQA